MRRIVYLLILLLNLGGLRAQIAGSSAVHFIKNQGQWDAAVRYRADVPGGFLFLKSHSMCYVFYDTDALSKRHAGSKLTAKNAPLLPLTKENEGIKAHAVEVFFENSNPSIQISESHKVAENRNYFIGNDPSRWARGVASFGEITYNELYPGINLKIYTYRQTLKYEFEVAPKADPKQIRMRYEGAENVAVKDNQLLIKTAFGSVRELQPYSFQEINEKNKTVETQIRLASNTLQFDFPKGYDTQMPLTIDPELVFSTFSGSTADNWGHTATFDADGNLYAGGTVFSAEYPTTLGVYQEKTGGKVDIGINKYSPDGKRLLYATFIGGSNTETPNSLIVNTKGELVIMGTTGSANFPMAASGYKKTFSGGSAYVPSGNTTRDGAINFSAGTDIFVAKLSKDGTQLLGSTYIGGRGNDGVSQTAFFNTPNQEIAIVEIRNYGDDLRGEVVLDNDDNVYVASSTLSTDFPITTNAPQPRSGGVQDGVLFKLDASLNNLLWSTYLGGTGFDAAYGLKVGASGAIYACGQTRSPNLPANRDAHHGTIGGLEDGFVAKYQGNNLQRLTYVGTPNTEVCYMIDTDKEENIYVLGLTNGRVLYPSTLGTYFNNRGAQFIHCLDANLTNTVFSTVLGSGRGTPDISPTAFSVNDCGNIYLAGWGGTTNSVTNHSPFSSTKDLPVTADAYQKTTNGNNFYLAILEKGAKSLLYGTFFGTANNTEGKGDHVDGGTSRFSKDGVVYHSTCACDGSMFPTTSGAWSEKNNSSNCNNAAFKFDLDRIRANFDTFDGTRKNVVQGCAPFTLDFQNTSINGKTYQWDIDGNVISRDPNQAKFVFDKPGQYKVTLRAFNPLVCNRGVDVATKTITVLQINAKASGDTTVCSDVAVQLKAEGGTSYLWSPSVGLSSATVANPTTKVRTTTVYSVKISSPVCEVTRSVTVRIDNNKPDFVAERDTSICAGNSAQLTARGGAVRYSWSPAQSLSDTNKSSVVATPQQTTVYSVVATYADGCRPTKTVTVRIDNSKPDFVVSPDTTICAGGAVQLLARGAARFRWTRNATLSDTTVANPVAKPQQNTTYSVTGIYADGCRPTKNVTVSIDRPLAVNFAVVQKYACGEPTSVQFTNSTPGATNRSEWIFGNGKMEKTISPAPVSYANDGSYNVTLKAVSAAGCEYSISKPIEVQNLNQLNNVITPNGDGKNDVFVVRIKDTALEVSDRWGKSVFKATDYQSDWGKDVQNGLYYYLLSTPNGQRCKGWIQVLE